MRVDDMSQISVSYDMHQISVSYDMSQISVSYGTSQISVSYDMSQSLSLMTFSDLCPFPRRTCVRELLP